MRAVLLTCFIESVGRTIAQHATSSKIVMPVRTAAAVERVLLDMEAANSGIFGTLFWILSSPVFLAEGTAMKDLNDPDRIVIGGAQTPGGIDAMQVIFAIYANWVPCGGILSHHKFLEFGAIPTCR